MVALQPSISTQYVHAALDNLLYSSAPKIPNPLSCLLLVDEWLLKAPLPLAENSRIFALNHILVSIITDEYANQRYVQNLGAPSGNPAREDTFAQLNEDAKTQSPEIIAWGWLWCHYAHPSLNITPKEFSQATNIDERTLRRYQVHAVHRLTEIITHQEWQMRLHNHKRRLFALLPMGGKPTLLGRDSDLNKAKAILENNHPCHLQITGATGIGKTAFVQALVQSEIDTGFIDHLIWINNPVTINDIQQQITENLMGVDSAISVREGLLLRRVCIVLDDVESASDKLTAAEIDALLLEWGSACVMLISRSRIILTNAYLIDLQELSKSDIESFVHSLVGDEYWEECFDTLFQHIGGNPKAIKLALRGSALASWHPDSRLALDQLYASIYTGCNPKTQHLWCILALSPAKWWSPEILTKLWNASFDLLQLEQLVKDNIAEIAIDGVYLPSSARNFIQMQYAADPNTQTFINNLLSDLFAQILVIDDEDLLYLIENILLEHWLVIDRDQWVKLSWRSGISYGHFATWSHLLRVYDTPDQIDTIDLQIGYATCLRQLGQQKQSQKLLESIISSTGRYGLFDKQALALMELATIFRLQGEYRKALSLLNRLRNTIERTPIECLSESVITMEYIQIVLDTNDQSALQNHFPSLPQTPRTLLLQAEWLFLKGEYLSLISLVHQYLEDPAPSRILSRLHTLLGRSYQSIGDLASAHYHFASALILLEKDGDDISGIAKGQGNLGGLFILLEDYETAETYLKAAEAIQLRLNEPIVLKAIQHNLHVLRTKIAH